MDMLALCLMFAKPYITVSSLRIASTFRRNARFFGFLRVQDKLITQFVLFLGCLTYLSKTEFGTIVFPLALPQSAEAQQREATTGYHFTHIFDNLLKVRTEVLDKS